jgi:hypothetical protein
MITPNVDYIISLEFWGTSDVVLTIGPLCITSVNTGCYDWGSFEILWGKRAYLYCSFVEDIDPYKGYTLGTGVPEWRIEHLGSSLATRKTICNSLTWFGPAFAWHERLIKRLRRT